MNQKGFTPVILIVGFIVLVIFLLLGTVGLNWLSTTLYKPKPYPNTNLPTTAQTTKELTWIETQSQDPYKYEYTLLPKGTKVAKITFSSYTPTKSIRPLSDGKSVLDNLTAGYTFANPLYDPKTGYYNQALYDSKDGVYKIKVQNFLGKQALFFSSAKPPVNTIANLHLFDNDLLKSSEIEGVVAELDSNNILEFVHYTTQNTTLEGYKADSASYQEIINSLSSPDEMIKKLQELCLKKDYKTVALNSLKEVNKQYELITAQDLKSTNDLTYATSAATLCYNLSSQVSILKKNVSNTNWDYTYVLNKEGSSQAYEIMFYNNDWRFILYIPVKIDNL